jgi:hypothetical protein
MHLFTPINRSILGVLALGAILNAGTLSFGPISVAGNAVIFDADNILTAAQLTALGSNGGLGAVAAMEALAFSAAAGQTFAFSASGLVGCCGSAHVGPDGSTSSSNINSLGSISGFTAPAQLALVGVFTNGSPGGAAARQF